MGLGDTLTVVNFAGLLILGFVCWVSMKAVRQQVLDLMNRELAEVRRQVRTAMKATDRLDDHVVENRERILKLEVNLMAMQDELEDMSRRLEKFMAAHALAVGEDPSGSDGGAEGPARGEDGRRHLY